ncbi:TetR family transcriptional regulator, partial [uncultured Aureimonas sp.]|uniref:TetR family transcriptional regulator n=1 Tax=uncultured Aureimonas sp. TaxID=1604662 RepID=UPI0025D652B1
MAAAGRRAEQMEATRAKLIAAARAAFAEKGYAAASMDELTAQAGLTRGALYHNFG